jgi:hypothetical protein
MGWNVKRVAKEQRNRGAGEQREGISEKRRVE